MLIANCEVIWTIWIWFFIKLYFLKSRSRIIFFSYLIPYAHNHNPLMKTNYKKVQNFLKNIFDQCVRYWSNLIHFEWQECFATVIIYQMLLWFFNVNSFVMVFFRVMPIWVQKFLEQSHIVAKLFLNLYRC